jgi:hypothetical protein
MISPDDPTIRNSVEAAMGRRTITADTFPDKQPYAAMDFLQTYGGEASIIGADHGLGTSFTEEDTNPNELMTKYMDREAFNEKFINTRECRGAARLNKKKGFSLPSEWSTAICETHCPEYNKIGTRADTAGNLSACARDALYDHMGWNAQANMIDCSSREYYGMQGYTYKERTA